MKNYLVINGYESKVFDREEKAMIYIMEKLEQHKNLNPTLISKAESEVKTFLGNVKLTTFIYVYDTLYTETFTVYESESYPLSSMKHYVEVMNHRKEMQPEVEKEVKEFKEWLNSLGIRYSVKPSEKRITFIKNENEESFDIYEDDRYIENDTFEDRSLKNKIYNKFCELNGWLEDILAAF